MGCVLCRTRGGARCDAADPGFATCSRARTDMPHRGPGRLRLPKRFGRFGTGHKSGHEHAYVVHREFGIVDFDLNQVRQKIMGPSALGVDPRDEWGANSVPPVTKFAPSPLPET